MMLFYHILVWIDGVRTRGRRKLEPGPKGPVAIPGIGLFWGAAIPGDIPHGGVPGDLCRYEGDCRLAQNWRGCHETLSGGLSSRNSLNPWAVTAVLQGGCGSIAWQ